MARCSAPGVMSVLASAILLAAAAATAPAAGSISGQGQFELIAGNPSMGYKGLYEWDLFLSPADNSTLGPSRRLGAPPGQMPTGDGFYRIDGMPAGTYSLYVNQPDFFASSKVVNGVRIVDGQETRLDVNLDVDYSTYFRDGGQWTGWDWDWYQTFTAVGTSVRGVSWVMAGAGQYGGRTAEVRILESDGTADPRSWQQVGYATDGSLASDSDEWVRWASGEVPMTPGKQYAVNIHIDGGMAIYKRNKDAQSYQGGEAWDQNGNRPGFDLNITVFADRDTMVTHTTKSSGPGRYDGGLFDSRWGQSFVATGTGLAAVDLFAAGGSPDLDLTWTVREGGPGGAQIGSAKTTRGAFFASSTKLGGVSYDDGQVPLTPGEVYYVEAFSPGGFVPYLREPWERDDDGQAFRNGSPTAEDLSMTIVEFGRSPDPIVRIDWGSRWKYLDDGSNQGSAWRERDFDDGDWREGRAQLGYGDGDEQTQISYGGDSSNKHITAYFRKWFTVPEADDVVGLVLELLRDDGAVIYLNGQGARRSNMPGGAIGYRTTADETVVTAEEHLTHTIDLDPELLVDGLNLLAVEVHQISPTSSDVSFDLELTAMMVPEPASLCLLAAAGALLLRRRR